MSKRGGWLAVFLLAAALVPVPLMAQPTPDESRVAVLATIGAMRPSQAPVRDLYSGSFKPVTIETDVRVYRQVFVFASGQFLRKDGEVVSDLPLLPEMRFPLRLSTSAVRIGGGVAFPAQRWLVSAQGGLSYTHYREKWVDQDFDAATGHVYGFIVQGGVDYRVFSRLWAVGRFEYSHTPIDDVRQTIPVWGLSGVSVSGGVAVRF